MLEVLLVSALVALGLSLAAAVPSSVPDLVALTELVSSLCLDFSPETELAGANPEALFASVVAAAVPSSSLSLELVGVFPEARSASAAA